MTLAALPAPVSDYIAATNALDIEAMMATFAEDALVNDRRNEFVGRDAIRDRAQREIVNDHVTMRPTTVACHGAAVVAALRDAGASV